MVLVITILAALLGIAAIGLSLQLNSTKSTALVKDSRASLYCAEAGLAAARAALIQNRSDWNNVLDGSSIGTWYVLPPAIPPEEVGIVGDLDGIGPLTADYSVVIRDDADGDNNLDRDNNDTIIVTSTCLLYPTAPATVTEIISLMGRGQAYRNQSGQGSGNTGNAN